jgi:hypothetical protein
MSYRQLTRNCSELTCFWIHFSYNHSAQIENTVCIDDVTTLHSTVQYAEMCLPNHCLETRLHNHAVLFLLGTDHIENTGSPILLHDVKCLLSRCLAMLWSNPLQYNRETSWSLSFCIFIPKTIHYISMEFYTGGLCESYWILYIYIINAVFILVSYREIEKSHTSH